MVRLLDILKKEELDRAYFDSTKLPSISKLNSEVRAMPAERLYRELLSSMRQVLLDILNAKQPDINALRENINLLIEIISKDDGQMLALIDRYDCLSEDYLVAHSVNVCILSLEVARGLHYGQNAMRDLGLGAFLLDVGMIRLVGLLKNKRRLYTAEYEEVKNHVKYGLEILDKIGQVNDTIISIVSQHHERMDGSGYLKGLKADEIGECAKIVGLADVYEALIHSRPHRDRFMPFEYRTIKEIISNRNLFDPYILRVFLDRLTRQPAYLLWLATSGIYDILGQHDKKTQGQVLIKPEIRPKGIKKYVFIAVITTVALITALSIFMPRTSYSKKDVFYPLGSSVSIGDNNSQALKIPYNFIRDAADTPSVSLDFSGMDLGGYYFLAFSSRIEDSKIHKMRYAVLKIGLENARRERSSYFVEGISNKWREFRIPLSYFDSIKDWSSVTRLSFVLQPWNIDGKEGTAYIDDVRFFRKK